MEMWSVIGENSNESFLLGYSDADIVLGKYNSNNQPVPCNSFNLKGPLSHVYNPSFFDFDKDGFPEMILRFNASTADGFIQYLYVYKSENNQDFCERKLIKEFSARNGFAKSPFLDFCYAVNDRLSSEIQRIKALDNNPNQGFTRAIRRVLNKDYV